MKIYRKIIPKIAKDIIRALLANDMIEIQYGRRDDAEIDIASVLVTYQNSLDKLDEDSREALVKHNFSPSSLGHIKQSLAKKRDIILGDEVKDHVINLMIKALFDSDRVIEIFAEDNEIRLLISDIIKKYIGVDVELDKEVRGRLKNLREGTPEWELGYNQLIEQMRSTA